MTIGLCESQGCLEGSCHVCHVHLRDLGDCIDNVRLRPLRTENDFMEVREQNSMMLGRAVDYASRLYMEQHGIDHVSAVVLMPGCNDYSIVTHDIAHNLALGEHGRIVQSTEKIFSRNVIMTSSGTDLVTMYYKRLSKAFRSCYTSINIDKHCSDHFTSFNQWKGLHAHGICIFMEAMPFLLLKLRLVNFNDNANVRSFKKVVLLSQIGQTASKHRISPNDINFLEAKIPDLLHMLAEDGESRVNNHLLLHLPDYIKLMGVPRDYWGMPYEMKHGFLKKLFANVNNKEISESVLRRYLNYIIIKVILEADVHDTMGLSRYKHLEKKRCQWPACTEMLVDVIGNGIEVVIEVDLIITLETTDFLCNQTARSEATICYTRCRINDYVMLAGSYTIAKIGYFLQHFETGKCYIGYQLPINSSTEIKHSLMEWRQFSKSSDETVLYIAEMESVYSVISKFDWSDSEYVVATCDALAYE